MILHLLLVKNHLVTDRFSIVLKNKMFLDVLDDAMITNMTEKEITDFIKKEISKILDI